MLPGVSSATLGARRPGADLHFHLLPGVDDGPAEVADSLDLARAAVEDGTGTVVATPHVRPDFVTDVHSLPQRIRELEGAMAAEGIDVRVRTGGELGHTMVGGLYQDELEAVAQGPPDGRWLLVEAPFEGMGTDFHAATGELRARGFGVLIAHPERIADAALDGAGGLRRELSRGALAQVNAQSLTGDHGEEAARAAFQLVADGLVAVVASDAHGPTRPPALSAARRQLLDRGVAPAIARELTHAAPRRLLARGIPAGELQAA